MQILLKQSRAWSVFHSKAVRLVLALACLGWVGLPARAGSPPTISSFSPGRGPVGSMVTIEGTGFAVPISVTFSGNVAAAGSFTSTSIKVTVPAGAETGPITVGTANGSVSTATDFVIGKAKVAVTLAVLRPKVTEGSGGSGAFTMSLSAPQTKVLVVDYAIKGTAVNGTDYKLLTGKETFGAGETSKNIKIVPKGDLNGAASKVVKLRVKDSPDYAVDTPDAVKVEILAGK